ncbi:MAG: sigma-70 family RNA polymerase sigma factor [Planctomycetota bacterium]|nr:sigma-70 family RNA polymerase sigma factor [Planctomycetota bacterium]
MRATSRIPERATLQPADHNSTPTPPPATDRELVAQCVRGDSHAWGELVGRFGPLIYSIAARCGLPPDGRDDVYQATFLSLHRSLNSLRDGQALAKWIITTASREAWNLSRQHKQHEPTAAESAAAIPDDQAIDALERARTVNEGRIENAPGQYRTHPKALPGQTGRHSFTPVGGLMYQTP